MKEWKKYKFEDIAILSTNKYYPKEDAKNYRCIELEHINQETGRINGWSNSIEQKSAKTYFKTGDILYGKLRPYLKKYYLAEFDGVCSTEIWVIKGKTNLVCNEFLFYLIQTEKFNFVANISTGTKMPRADWDYIKSTIFKIPPLPEQRKITEILSTWDKAIELKEQLIEEKKEQKKGLMQKLLRGEIRLPGFGREEAKKTRLKGYIKEIKRKNTKEKINKILSVTNTNGFIEQHEQFDKGVASSNLSNYKIIEKGEFAYNPSRINVGSIDLLRNYEAGVLSPMYIVFKTEKEKLLPEYLYQYVKSDEFYAQIKSFLQGSVRQSLSFKALEMIRLFIPKSLKEQEAIARLLSTADKEIELLEGELEQLKLQKKGLMQLLLTGIIRVKC
ncbi:MAG: restriction endonuclease subunit S [Clostridiales bacterium]|nr:restriction endonuclease subunit S [Clostridiales bacterium]